MLRFDLIARKNEVRQAIERLRRRLEQEQNAADFQRNRRRIAQLERELATLMAKEHNLRQAIDRSK